MRADVLGLQAFISIAERGSFRAAASHLNLSQTALSHRVRKLEDALGTPLLLRTTRQVSLTAAGTALLRARRVFEDLAAAIDQVKVATPGREAQIAVGCLPTVAVHCLPGVIAEFARRHPGLGVRVHDNSAAEIADKVQSGEAEFGVTIVAANRWDLELRPVVKEPFVLVGHRDMPLAGATALSWADLQGEPLVRISAETGNRILIDDALGPRRETLTWRCEVQRVVTALGLVRARIGYAVVPQLALGGLDAGELVAIPLRAPAITRTLGIVTRKTAPLRPAARDLLALLSAQLKRSVAPRDR